MKKPTTDILYVLTQFVLLCFLLLDFSFLKLTFPPYLHYIGLVLLLVGGAIIVMSLLKLNNNLTPFPTPVEGGSLIEDGIFKYIRHPIYAGILYGAFGWSIFTDSGTRIVITLLLVLLFYFKSNYEEEQLQKAYPNYKEYKKSNYKFFPKFF